LLAKIRLRTYELLYGILIGSLAGAFLPIGFERLVKLGASRAQGILAELTRQRVPIVVATLAILALILPRFWYASVRLFRSWRAGIVRGVSLVWAASVFCFWVKRDYWPFFLVIGAAFQILVGVVQTRQKRKECTAQEIAEWIPRSTRSTISAIVFNRPIEAWDQDAVGRQDFVETVLARVLIECEPAVGITADFGEGKSSVLHLLRESIDRGGRAIAVPFRAWLPGSEEAFVDSLFGTATASVRAKFFLPAWRSALRTYSRAVLGVVPPSWNFLTDLLPPDSQLSRIEELARLVSKLPMRLVFLLDEVDRMHAEELTVLLKILRGAPELVNVSYVCAFSKDAVAGIVSPQDLKFGLRSLEKFFPVELQLPAIDEDLRGYLFSERIDATLQREQLMRAEDSRKRFEDARRDLWHHAIKRRMLPSTYEFVYQNGQLFHGSPRVMERWSVEVMEIDEQARTKRIAVAFNGYFKTLPEGDRDLALNLLSLIFPSVKNYARENSLGSFPVRDQSEQRRIADPDYFLAISSITFPQPCSVRGKWITLLHHFAALTRRKLLLRLRLLIPGQRGMTFEGSTFLES
jgi:KAP family P-loop domain